MQILLECIAKYDPQIGYLFNLFLKNLKIKIGYVQGMNFIAAALLYHAEEYIAFWLFILIFERFEMRDIYLPSNIFSFKGLLISFF